MQMGREDNCGDRGGGYTPALQARGLQGAAGERGGRPDVDAGAEGGE